jgi:fructose-1,6-bisphosphatase I
MSEATRLETYLEFIVGTKPALAPVRDTVLAIAEAGRLIRRILARGPLAGELSALVGDSGDGDGQKALDVITNDLLRDALATSPVAAFASEESDEVEILDLHAKLAVALDPLDGSSNIDTLAPVGTIFSILPAAGVPADSFLQSGRHQLAAGFLIYGPQTALAITLGEGTRIFTLDPESGAYLATRGDIKIPQATREYAINSSNQRHWEPQIRGYVNELVMGRGGPRAEDFNTRWLASVVADAYRILIRGGVYLYPGDYRRGYQAGRLRLVYEANPIAMLMENAEGAATDGRLPIMDIVPTSLHQRCPLVFGSCDEVRRVAAAYDAEVATESPLFKSRSLFRKSITSGGTLA